MVLETCPVDVECPGDDYLPWGFGAYGTVLYIQGPELCFEVLHGFYQITPSVGAVLCKLLLEECVRWEGREKRRESHRVRALPRGCIYIKKSSSVGADPTTRSKCLE